MEIKYVNHSIANRFSGSIELNKNLKKYPELLKPILKHELQHTDKAFTFHDFKHDFFSNSGVDSWKLIKFMFKYPKSFLQISPILYSKKRGLVIDINLFILYLVMLVMFGSTIYFGVKYL